jgi:hypothetical protein
VSEFVPEDPDAIAIAEAWRENPSGTASQIAAHAAAAQFEALAPAVEEVLSLHRQRLHDANAAEAVEAMDKTYGDAWQPYKAAVEAYIEANPDILEGVIDSPQKTAERLQAIYRTVRPQVDAEARKDEWKAVGDAPPSYADVMFRSGR